jgi:BMFP domain-containing protein YqiC
MQTINRFAHDAARVATSAASIVVGVKQEVDSLVRQRIERLAADFDLVTREEFDAVSETASNARTAQETLEARVELLEQKLRKTAAARKKPETS